MAPLALPVTNAELFELAKTDPEDFKRAIKEDNKLLWSNKDRGPSVMYDLAKEGLLGLASEQIVEQPYLLLQAEGGENVMEAAIGWGKLEQLVPFIAQLPLIMHFYRKKALSFAEEHIDNARLFAGLGTVDETIDDHRRVVREVQDFDRGIRDASAAAVEPLKVLLASQDKPVTLTAVQIKALRLAMAAAGVDTTVA